MIRTGVPGQLLVFVPFPAPPGLGLSIVQAITHAHNGTIHTEPHDGGGLTITITLPAATS